MVVGKPFPLLAAFLFTQHCYAQKLPCDIPNDAEGSYSFILRDNKLFYFCLNDAKVLKVSTCLKGKWKPNVEENCLESIQQHLLLKTNDYSRSRFRRSPNVGKFESLKRQERVQRKIKNGQLSTKMEHNTPTIVRVHPGNRAFLLCRIQNLGTNSVLWSKQSRVLSIDTLRITDDVRFLPSHDEATRTWTLEVKGIRPTDEGDYVCQVNTRPPLKHFVSLQVIPIGVPLLPPVTQSIARSRIDEIDEMRANISAIWSEINRIGQMVNIHVQDGHHHPSHRHENDDHQHHHHPHGNETQEISDQIDDHSNHTHETEHHHDDQHYHQDHPHESHGDHHPHPDEQSGHQNQHVGKSGRHHHHDEQIGHNHHHDDSHEVGNHVGDQVPHGHKPQSHENNSDEEESKGNYPNYGHKGYDHHKHHHQSYSHGHHSHHHFTNGHHHGSSSRFFNVPDRSDESGSSGEYPRTRGANVVKTHGIGDQKLDLNSQSIENEIVQQAICDMKPNSEISGSKIKGDIKVFQKRYDKGPIYYSLKLKGFSVGKDERSKTHGFHIHEKALDGKGLCNSAGAHFNPLNQTHGSLNSKKRHLGDFGNIGVDKYGTLLESELTDSSNRLRDIVGKSMVVHELPDDFGKGGNLESLKTGNAGRRLACCTIHLAIDQSIRFNG